MWGLPILQMKEGSNKKTSCWGLGAGGRPGERLLGSSEGAAAKRKESARGSKCRKGATCVEDEVDDPRLGL